MSKKKLVSLAIAATATMMSVMPAFAAGWTFDGPENWQWRYENEDGSRPVSTLQQIDGKWYRFDSEGYLDIGWRWNEGTCYYFHKTGDLAMAMNETTDTGYFNECGAFHTYHQNELPSICADSDTAYWAQKVIQYGYNGITGVKTMSDKGYGITRFTFPIPANAYEVGPGEGITIEDYRQVAVARVNQEMAMRENWTGVFYINYDSNTIVYDVDDVWGSSYEF